MTWQQTPYTIPLIAVAAISVISALYVWRNRHTASSKTGALLLLSSAAWITGYALELASADLLAKVLWDKVEFAAICIVPTAWMVYVFQYTGREKWVTRRTLALLSIVPLITLLLVFTNEVHGLIWSRVWLNTDGAFSVKHGTYGVGLWTYAAYAYILVLIGIFLLIQALFRSGHLYRWQASALLFAVFTPWLANAVVDLSGLKPFPYLELTPIAIGVTAPVIAWNLYRLRIRDIVPVARETVIESMSDGIIVLDAQNRVVQLNPAAQYLIGHAASEALGQPVEQVWPEWPGGMELCDGTETGQKVVLGQGDEQRTYDVRISPLSDWRGRLTSQVVVLRDITERKRTERELRESEEKYKTLVEDAPMGIYYSDFNGTFLYGNKRAEEIVGYKREELIGKSYLKLKLLDLKEIGKAIKLLAQNKLGRATGPDEFILNRKDGSKRIAEICTTVITIGGKQVVLGMVEDITERKRAEKALQESEERYRLHFENVTDVVYAIDLEFRVLSVSPSVEKLLGYKPEELIGRPFQELNVLAPDCLETAFSDTMRVLAGEQVASSVYEFIAKDGTRKFGEVSGAPLIRDGKVVAVVSVGRDITERVRAEKQIQASLREKEVLLKEIHHRVKNNLQVISSLLYLQSKNIEDKETLEMFQESQNRVRSMALVHERLYQSQDLARVDFAEYVRNLASYLFRSYDVNANVVQLKINVDDVFLGVDIAIPYGLMINELVSNSLKHAFPHGKEGEIGIELRADDEGQVTLMVRDNGVGFPQDLDFQNTKSLGLQLVNTLAAQLEGTIELDRSAGTAFEMTFTELK